MTTKLFHKFSNNYIGYLLLSIAVFLGFLVRLYKIDNPVADWHSWRQADTASVGRIYLAEGINILYPRYYDISSIQTGITNLKGFRFVEFPIYNALHAYFAGLTPSLSFEAIGRLLSIIFSLISSILIFLIGKRFLGLSGGLLSSIFFLFLPYNVYFSRVILPEPAAVTFALLGIFLYIRYLDGKGQGTLIAAGFTFALSMLIKPFTFFYLPPIAYLAYQKYGARLVKDARIVIPNLVFLNCVLVPFFLWRIWINQFPAGIPHFGWAFNGDKIRFRPSFFRWIFGERIGNLILGIWGVVPFVFGLLAFSKKTFFNLAFMAGVVLYVVVFATANVRHDYYQIFLIPPISLLLAQGSLAMWRAKDNVIIVKGVLIFSILVGFLVSATSVREFYKVNHPEIIEAGHAIDKIAPKDALIIAPYNGDTAFLYQTGRFGWPVVEDSIENLIKKGADYFVAVNFADPDVAFVEKNFTVLEKTDKYMIADLSKRKDKSKGETR